MSRKKGSLASKTTTDTIDFDRRKYGKWAAILLLGLTFGILFCLICGWLPRDTSGEDMYNEINDNMVTSLIQNYNYILAALVLVPVIAYIYSKIKGELKTMAISDELIVLYGFLIGVCTLIMICVVCNITYNINISTYYGLYSANTVGIFLTMVIVLIVISTICFIVKCINLLNDEKTFWSAVKKYLPIILMVMFLIWTFISCMLAPRRCR